MAFITLPDNANVSSILFLAGADPLSSTYQGEGLHVEGITQEDLDAALAVYLSDEETHLLGPTRLGHSKHFAEQVVREIEDRYSSFRRELFLAIYVEAVSLGLANRAAYVVQLLTWVKEAVSVCIEYEAALSEADSVSLIGSVSDSTAEIDIILAADPEVTIKAALEILD